MSAVKTITMRRSELVDFEDLFRQAGTVSRAEAEDLERYKKFKYWVGRNWDKIMSEIKAAQKKVAEIMAPDARFIAFERAVDRVNREFCMKNEDGAPVIEEQNGQQRYKFDKEGASLREGAIVDLKAMYSDAITAQEGKDKVASDFMQDIIDVEIFTVPWAWIPERVSGPYMGRLAVMCTEIPADMQEPAPELAVVPAEE